MSSFGGTATANGPSSTTEQAKEKAQQGARQAKRGLRSQVDQRSTAAGERVSAMAGDARSVAEELRNQGKDQPAKLAEQAAQRVESLGDYLQGADGDKILRDVEDFGRRRPWAVIAGGLALGFAASRFLKASSSRRYEQQRHGGASPAGLTSGAPTTRTGLDPRDASAPPRPPMPRDAGTPPPSIPGDAGAPPRPPVPQESAREYGGTGAGLPTPGRPADLGR